MTHTINLICTTHTERGNCSPEELYKVIEHIAPEVIFEELPESLFDRYYNKNEPIQESLEVTCIKRYLKNHTAKHFPVDIEVSSNIVKQEIEYMLDVFGQYDAYRALEDKQRSMTEMGGFAFLNSKQCMEIFEQKKHAEQGILGFANNKQHLLRIYKLFHQEQDNRETKMLENIYNYSRNYPYRQALFLIGAAHRRSLMQKIADLQKKEEIRLNWMFGDAEKKRPSLGSFFGGMFKSII